METNKPAGTAEDEKPKFSLRRELPEIFFSLLFSVLEALWEELF